MKTLEITLDGKNYKVDGIRISGHAGNYKIEGIINNESYSGTSSNSNLMDDYNESDDYFESDDSGHWFNCAQDVDIALAAILIAQNNL